MANFTALNIEPDDQSDDEVDNTKELQIEEALKLYQNALKYHSQGPTFFNEAAEAYTNLLQSDIFRYPESLTEFTRVDTNPDYDFGESAFAALDLVNAGSDGALSTLPQILYLSHKNHGQFILDCVKHSLKLPYAGSGGGLNEKQLDYQAKGALDSFARALASDESDTELWRRAARVGSMLGSRRIARYCLEAAVELDDDPTFAEVEPPSLEEGFAGTALKGQLEVLSDEVALSHPIMNLFKKKTMAPFFTKHLDPYPYLPDPTKVLEVEKRDVELDRVAPIKVAIDLLSRTWKGLGDSLAIAVMSPAGSSAKGVILRMPPDEDTPEDAPLVASTEDQVMKDAPMTESPVGEKSTPAATASRATANPEEQPVQVITTTTTVPVSDGRQRSHSIGLPTRKRSQSAAGIRDTPEDDNGAHKRSKRIRNRDTTSDQIDPTTQFAEQLQNFVRADTDTFAFVGDLLSKFGVNEMGTFPDFQESLSREAPTDRADILANTAARDLRDVMKNWDDDKASTFVNGNAQDILGSSAGGANAGLAAFLENNKSGPIKQSSKLMFPASEGLESFVAKVDADWLPLQDVTWAWVCEVLVTYEQSIWPEDLKISIVRLISFDDTNIFARVIDEAENAREDRGSKDLGYWEVMTQTLFELHLDIYARITNPSSIVNMETRITTKDRLDRWAGLAADVIRPRSPEEYDELSIRYLWASVYYATMADSVSREHKVLCWSDLQAILEENSKAIIDLPNNAIMPEISVSAAEREVSRLSTMDFFFNLFQTDTSDPVAIVETLEPVLDPNSASTPIVVEGGDSVMTEAADNTPAALREMWKFLKSGSTSLRLFLWQRLREAYQSLSYSTKIFSCFLKSIEVIVADMHSDSYVDSTEGPRHHQLLLWLKALDDLLVRSLTMALNDTASSFEIIDDRHLKSTCAALAQLNRVLHSAALSDDGVRVGMNSLPHNAAYGSQGSFTGFANKLREMQVRTWALQYTMVKEATMQNREIFTQPDKDLADFLALVHYSLGLRKACKSSNKIFLKMMKVEMIRLKHVDKWEDYLGQVLYDLYGLRLGVGTYLLDEHGCPPETLDKRTVLNIAEQVIELADSMSMKDLLKHELRATIEKMQTAIGAAKSTPQMQHNLRNLTEYLKTSLRPLHMYQALKGQVEVDSIPAVTTDTILAEKGWYFLQGMIAFTKFRSQKRTGPGGQTDDMKIAASFFRLQLQYTTNHWETWYRLSQCFDSELEDEILWTADKINHDRPALVRLQRSAIHCYIMALSTAMRCADDSTDTANKINEMYYDFAMRLYASSREPFTMEAFYVDDFEKHMSGSGEVGMYKQELHKEMTRAKVWQYAAELFRRSAVGKADSWMTHFMLGKCRWKLFTKVGDDNDRAPASKPSIESILTSFVKAIQTVPKPRDSRQEAILEPHYKLVSVVHKLVIHGAMLPQAGADLLQEQPYAIRKEEHVEVPSLEDWEPFVLESFRHLRSADKQHWHHRMIARVAHILYDENDPGYDQAVAARNEFRESIFTKSMLIQVWKPEAERSGRHCVYMNRYVTYMMKLLSLTSDKPNMEALVKRVRKKANDFYKFEEVWNECCIIFLRNIRSFAQIPPNMEEIFKSVPHDDFETYSERLQNWMADPVSSHKALDALREAFELKKLNAGMPKLVVLDDLINDAWAMLYIQVGVTLSGPDLSTQPGAQVDGASDAPVRSVMSLNNLVMNMDGTQIPIPVTIAGPSDPTARQKPKVGIARREVLRRAETALSRVPEVQRPVSTPKPRGAVSDPPASLVLGSNAPPLAPEQPSSAHEFNDTTAEEAPKSQNENEQEANEEEEKEEPEEEDKEDGRERESSTAPGSVHDSADDESDLSDVPDMDEAEQAMMFPGLIGTAGSSAGTPKS